jgi:hypothetical protein
MIMNTPETPTRGCCPPPPCSAEIAAELYRLLEYYRNFMPFCVGKSESNYATTREAINADAALAAYREQTGMVADRKPSEPNNAIYGPVEEGKETKKGDTR